MMLALFFCHLVAAGAFGLLLLGYGIACGQEKRQMQERLWTKMSEWAFAGATALLPAVLFLRVALGRDGYSAISDGVDPLGRAPDREVGSAFRNLDLASR
jgi:hypothetical protein